MTRQLQLNFNCDMFRPTWPSSGNTQHRQNTCKDKGKGKVQRGNRCIALLFLKPRRKKGVGGQRHAPAALPPGKTPYPLYRRLGGPQGRSGRVQKISPSTGIRSPDRPVRSESLYRLSYPGPKLGRIQNFGFQSIFGVINTIF